MFGSVARKVFGSRNDRLVKVMRKSIDQINALESEMQALNDEQLKAKTTEFRERAAQGETIEQLLTEAFAVVREASSRCLQMRHFDVQLIGGMVLNEGRITEMRTGEGKTLVATLPAYLNSVAGQTVHIVTVNDYLAQRDANWMGKLYNFLGLSVGVVISGQDQTTKREAYTNDIVYGTNNEFGFDYLRDNMAFAADERAQRSLDFAIIDEVDSILIDEARTPLIISGPAENSTDLYVKINQIIPKLIRQEVEDGPGDFSVDEKTKQAYLTEDGHETCEKLLEQVGLLEAGSSLYDVGNISLMHHLNAGLRAHTLFQRDVDYIVQNDEVIIIDEFTGRMMAGRRWSDGLHQAVEAKEGAHVQHENQTLASITFQNYFRLYDKLSGMTGTADTEAAEFQQIYGLEVVVIPTHQDMVRDDRADLVYRTMDEKYNAIVEGIQEAYAKQQPVLLGTASIESSELLSKLLKQAGVKHEVLNAKQHEREAHIISQAGQPGAVTIATNMAGRGTDIVLGGNLEMELAALGDDVSKQDSVQQAWQKRHQQVLDSGGLHVIGTERHESRRIDNQLRGRSGRQGDPGSSRFYLSLHDSLMRIFASDRVASLMQKLGMEEGEAIEHPWVTRAIENAQRKVEGRNFDSRKQLLEYDDVANEQRKIVYNERNNLMDLEDVSNNVESMRDEVVNSVIDSAIPPQSIEEQWNIELLESDFEHEFGLKLPISQWLEENDELHEETLRERLLQQVTNTHNSKLEELTEPVMRHLEKSVILQVLDTHWKEHLAAMDHLRQGIGLRGYAQKNPKQEYKREAFEMFTSMLDRVKHDVITLLARVQLREEDQLQQMDARNRDQSAMQFSHPDAEAASAPADSSAHGSVTMGQTESEPVETFIRDGRKIGRNEPCPCGSGKKYKQCHGKLN